MLGRGELVRAAAGDSANGITTIACAKLAAGSCSRSMPSGVPNAKIECARSALHAALRWGRGVRARPTAADPVVLLITPDPMGQSASNSGDIDSQPPFVAVGMQYHSGLRG